MEDIELYQNVKKRWEQTEATNKGVLGGRDDLNKFDIDYSIWFLDILRYLGHIKGGRALDCCAGIGRVTENVLSHYFDEIDLFDQDQEFIDKAKKDLYYNKRVRRIECQPMQTYQFKDKYDTIWIQWCFENLEDQDLKIFLDKCKNSLTKNGLIMIRENICNDSDELYQSDDCKVRSQDSLREIFSNSNLEIIYEHIPTYDQWPEELFRVACFALKPQKIISILSS